MPSRVRKTDKTDRGLAITTADTHVLAPKLSLIFPSRRPEKLAACLDELVRTTATYNTEIIVVAENSEIVQAADPFTDKIIVTEPIKAIDAWNLGASFSTGDWFFLGADDLCFHEGWLDALWPYLTPQYGVVGTNDLMTSWERLAWATHFAVSRSFAVEHQGGVFVPPCYHHYFPDPEVCNRAKQLGMFVYVDSSHTEHMHPDWGKGEMDSIYGKAKETLEDDRKLYVERLANDFPIVWEPVIHA